MAKSKSGPPWANWADEEILEVRFKDLGISIEGTYLEKCIRKLNSELEAWDIPFEPHCYLGDEWFSPDGVPAIAIPFYLTHPRLIQLEHDMMLEAEGAEAKDTFSETMKFLRHECGHAICHGYQLTKRRDWKKVFGSPKNEFSDYYRYRPYSRNYVRNLENCYAQSHPEEDFCETFAVWLNPSVDWRTSYQTWPALRKLQYVERLMKKLAGTEPTVTDIDTPSNVRKSKKKLKTHYAERMKLYSEDNPAFFDRDLRRLFQDTPDPSNGMPAARFLQEERKKVQKSVAFWTRGRRYTVDRLLRRLITRCRELKLYTHADHDLARIELSSYLSSLVSHYLFTGRYKNPK